MAGKTKSHKQGGEECHSLVTSDPTKRTELGLPADRYRQKDGARQTSARSRMPPRTVAARQKTADRGGEPGNACAGSNGN